FTGTIRVRTVTTTMATQTTASLMNARMRVPQMVTTTTTTMLPMGQLVLPVSTPLPLHAARTTMRPALSSPSPKRPHLPCALIPHFRLKLRTARTGVLIRLSQERTRATRMSHDLQRARPGPLPLRLMASSASNRRASQCPPPRARTRATWMMRG
ncbi:hypothetical protein FRC06_004525, partial [Ceratobasidium sp. 370]